MGKNYLTIIYQLLDASYKNNIRHVLHISAPSHSFQELFSNTTQLRLAHLILIQYGHIFKRVLINATYLVVEKWNNITCFITEKKVRTHVQEEMFRFVVLPCFV